MSLNDLSMVLIYVSDVTESVEWYQATLDLPVLYQDQGFASLGVGEQRIGLHAGKLQAGKLQAGESEPSASSQTIPVFGVSDYPASRAALEAKGCEFTFENETPNAIFGTFSDPDGNAFQIMQTRVRE